MGAEIILITNAIREKSPIPQTPGFVPPVPTQCIMRSWIQVLVGTTSDQQVIRSHQYFVGINIVADLCSVPRVEREPGTSPLRGGEKTGGEFYAGADHFGWILGLNQHTFPSRSM